MSRASQLRIAHLNTQSMVSSFGELQVTLAEYPIDILTMSETWLKNNSHLLSHVAIPGYNCVFRNRDEIRGGGVGAYLREEIEYKRRQDLENKDPQLEHLWLEILGRNRHSKLLLGTIHRSERMLDYNTWIEKFENLLAYITTEWDGVLLIMGDFNIDLLDYHSTRTVRYKNMLNCYNLSQHAQLPTRVTLKSSTLIDHVLSNVPNRATYTDVLPCSSISDHDSPYVCINVRVKRFQPRYKMIRNETKFDEKKFLRDFSELPFNLIYSTDYIDDKLDLFNSLFISCLDRHAPLKKVKVTRSPAPWLKSEDIHHLQVRRNQLRYQAHQTKSENTWKKFRDVRNLLRTKIKQAKRSYQKALSSRELWRTIHRILNPSSKPIRADADELNRHFSNTTQRILGTKSSSIENPRNYINSL